MKPVPLLQWQAFNWESNQENWWQKLIPQAQRFADLGFTVVWLPPPTTSVAPQGYMPLDYYNRYSANVNGVTQSNVQTTAQRYVDPGHLAIVIVGDLKVIEPKIRALNLAPIEIRGIDGGAAR